MSSVLFFNISIKKNTSFVKGMQIYVFLRLLQQLSL
jgi:hypothetical protein